MATITRVRHLDDLEKQRGREVVAERPGIAFELDGKCYTIDLSEENHAKLCEELAPFIASARRAGGGRRAAQVPSQRARTSADREQHQAVREWANRQGIKVSGHGRIPAEVLAAYQEEHTRRAPGAPATNGHAVLTDPFAPPAARLTPPPPAPEPPTFATKAARNKAIREWAAGKGVQLAERGKLPSDVVEQYVRVHGEPIVLG